MVLLCSVPGVAQCAWEIHRKKHDSVKCLSSHAVLWFLTLILTLFSAGSHGPCWWLSWSLFLFAFTGIGEALHSAQRNHMQYRVRRHRCVRSAALQSGHQMPAPRSRIPLRLGCDCARTQRAAAGFDQEAGESKALRWTRIEVSNEPSMCRPPCICLAARRLLCNHKHFHRATDLPNRKKPNSFQS